MAWPAGHLPSVDTARFLFPLLTHQQQASAATQWMWGRLSGDNMFSESEI